MTLVKYRIFQTVSNTMSFTLAAEALNMTQSAVSHAISSLENDFGFALFKRIKNKVELTNEGIVILAKINLVLSDEQKIINEVNALKNLDSGTIKLGSFSSASSRFLPPIIKTFEAKYPNIKLKLYEGNYAEIQTWLDEGIIDVAFLADKYINKSYYKEMFFKDEMVAIVPTALSEEIGESLDLKNIENYPFIMPNNVRNNYLVSIFKENNIHPNVKYNIHLNSTVFAMIESGLGISVVAESTLLKSRYNFKTIPFTEPILREIYITTNTPEINSNVIRIFFEIATQI